MISIEGSRIRNVFASFLLPLCWTFCGIVQAKNRFRCREIDRSFSRFPKLKLLNKQSGECCYQWLWQMKKNVELSMKICWATLRCLQLADLILLIYAPRTETVNWQQQSLVQSRIDLLFKMLKPYKLRAFPCGSHWFPARNFHPNLQV